MRMLSRRGELGAKVKNDAAGDGATTRLLRGGKGAVSKTVERTTDVDEFEALRWRRGRGFARGRSG
jgi:hypothetical protein